ncbi:hypothetical protein THIOSC13_1800019 [uncultured Thiomicrorhabdus sp.]
MSRTSVNNSLTGGWVSEFEFRRKAATNIYSKKSVSFGAIVFGGLGVAWLRDHDCRNKE